LTPGGNPLSEGMGMMEKLKMAAEVKKKADAMNLELTSAEIKALDPSGLAQVTVSGLGAPLRVIVSPELAKKVTFYLSLLS
jgi:DNA-binding protein YbaB